jgi:hypothetical protein
VKFALKEEVEERFVVSNSVESFSDAFLEE